MQKSNGDGLLRPSSRPPSPCFLQAARFAPGRSRFAPVGPRARRVCPARRTNRSRSRQSMEPAAISRRLRRPIRKAHQSWQASTPAMSASPCGNQATDRREDNAMEGMGGMMWGMGLIWVLVLVVAVLLIMALVKYLRS